MLLNYAMEACSRDIEAFGPIQNHRASTHQSIDQPGIAAATPLR